MELFNRASLKNFFKNGSTPSESSFAGLIDSTINKLDDGFSKTAKDGIRLAPLGNQSKLLSFFKHIQDQNPKWDFTIDPGETDKGLQLSEDGERVALFFKDGGGIGVGTREPNSEFDVDGTIAAKSRIGRFKKGQIPADGEWHVILEKIEKMAAFECVAKVEGPEARGKHAMALASIFAVHGRGKAHIKQAVFGWFWDKIVIRVKTNSDNSARVEIRTRSHYGKDENGDTIQIDYHITSLWSNS
jgi:hypothetical protein